MAVGARAPTSRSRPGGAPAPGPAPFDANAGGGPTDACAALPPAVRPAGDLLAGAAFVLAPTIDLGLDPAAPSAALSRGAAERLGAATEALGYLDVPTAAAARRDRHRRDRPPVPQGERRAPGLFDRGGPPAGPDTFFRGVRYDFEPTSWLRCELLGADPFEGTSTSGGQSGTGGPFAGDGGRGAARARARRRGRDPRAARRSCDRGRAGRRERRGSSLPASLFAREGGAALGDKIVTNTLATEEAGVRARGDRGVDRRRPSRARGSTPGSGSSRRREAPRGPRAIPCSPCAS